MFDKSDNKQRLEGKKKDVTVNRLSANQMMSQQFIPTTGNAAPKQSLGLAKEYFTQRDKSSGSLIDDEGDVIVERVPNGFSSRNQ